MSVTTHLQIYWVGNFIYIIIRWLVVGGGGWGGWVRCDHNEIFTITQY